MEPSKKSSEIDQFLEDKIGRTTAIKNNKCVFCKQRVNRWSFRDLTSHREYTISGLCQKCQDEVFGK